VIRFKDIDEDLASVVFSSKKLLDLGFEFKYSLEEMFAGAVETCREKGLIPLSHRKQVVEECKENEVVPAS
jgi:bifunctional dihydroflavonol 4-reductase/flavanone 4-reductase